jgi:hypothetical protein
MSRLTYLLLAMLVFVSIAAAGDFNTGETSITRLSDEERAAMLGGFRFPEAPVSVRAYPDAGALPPALDWRDTPGGSYVSGVREQGICGSCWAFAAMGTFEAMMMITNDAPDTDINLAEQYILSCVYGGSSCQGGWLEDAFEFLRMAGAPAEGCFTYMGNDAIPCRASCHTTLDLVEKLDGWWNVTFDDADQVTIKTALQEGPLAATLMIHDNFMGYTDGIYDAHGSSSTGNGHTVLLVGYDDVQQCWIAKNSWGTGWGEDGFFRVAYDDGCGFAAFTFACDYDPQWSPSVVWSPAEITAGEPVTIEYDASVRPLQGLAPLTIHWGHDDWQDVTDVVMTSTGPDQWSITLTPPAGSLSLEFVFTDGLGTWDNNGGADWIVHLAGTAPAFIMDGLLEASAHPIATNGTLTLWSAYAAPLLYVAVQDDDLPRTQDLFILVATDPLGMRSAPWTKAGSTVAWDWFLAAEIDNGWSGWFDFGETVQNTTAYQRANGVVLEGTLDLDVLMPGRAARELWLAAAAYETPAAGALIRQAPAGDGDDSITSSEMVHDIIVPNERVLLDVRRTGAGVEITWDSAIPLGGDLSLVAAAGASGWPVPFATDGGLCYYAVDRSPAARGGVEITYRLQGRRVDGSVYILAESVAPSRGAGTLRLDPVYPNPANPGLDVRFALALPGRVVVRILDARGRLVDTLLDEARPVGAHTVSWDGQTRAGSPAASGVYFAQVVSGDHAQTRKLTLAR